MEYVAVFAIVVGCNLLPAFGPPTWLILVIVHAQWHGAIAALVVVGALAACSGRYVLARGAQRLKPFLPKRYIRGVERAATTLLERKASATAAIGLFLISPLPSAQLFIAAGFLELPLVPVTLAFGLGRLVTYSLYLTLASVATASLTGAFGNFFGSPLTIALEVVLVAATVVVPLLFAREPEPT